MGKCIYCGTLGKNNKKATLHRFPRDEPIRKEWLKRIGLEGLDVRNHTLLCSSHFTEDCFTVFYCNRRHLKLGSMPSILKKEARFQKLQDGLVGTNCTDKAQDVAKIPEKENCKPQRNVSIDINSVLRKDDTRPTSIIRKVPEPSVIIEYGDSPTTSKEIFSQEKWCSRNKKVSLKRKYKCVTPREAVSHDHSYEDTPHSLKMKLNYLRKKYATIVKQNRMLKQNVRRLKKKVNSLQDPKGPKKREKLLSDGDKRQISSKSTGS